MLMLEHFDNLVDASARAISNIKFDKVVVWDGNSQNGTSATANWLSNMARTLPPIMQVMKDVGGVQLPETFGNLAGTDQKAEPAAEPSTAAPPAGRRGHGHEPAAHDE
jgi:flotillin